MKLFPPVIVRYYIKYAIVILLFILPVSVICGLCVVYFKVFLFGKATVYECFFFGFLLVILILIMGSSIIILHTSMWEKCWAVLYITDNKFVWKCPFRKNIIIFFTDIKVIGVYKENESNGISKDKIYISKLNNPLQFLNKKGELKTSTDLIVFWATKENIDILIEKLDRNMISKLVYYRIQQKKQASGN